jgi:hypothetical protein
VLELPATPVAVVEHRILKRYCSVCAAYQTPRVSFAGVVLGQGRIGVRLASLIGALRTSYRLLARCYRQTTDHPAQVLAHRLHRYESEVFDFIRTPGVSPTNNLAERTVRPQVIARKISGGPRSPAGSAIRCDLATVFHTWTARGLNPFAACVDALQTL